LIPTQDCGSHENPLIFGNRMKTTESFHSTAPILLPMNFEDETTQGRPPETNSPVHLSAEAGFTIEMEARILNAWEESKDPANCVGPFNSAEAFISYLKSSNEPH
jgi:hypothetical protein